MDVIGALLEDLVRTPTDDVFAFLDQHRAIFAEKTAEDILLYSSHVHEQNGNTYLSIRTRLYAELIAAWRENIASHTPGQSSPLAEHRNISRAGLSGHLLSAVEEIARLNEQPDTLKNESALKLIIDLCRSTIEDYEEVLAAPVRAQIIGILGYHLYVLGDRTSDINALRDSATAFRAFLEVPGGDYDSIGTAYLNWGNSLQRLGALTGDTKSLRDAAISFSKAVEIFQQTSDQRSVALAQSNWAGALQSTAELELNESDRVTCADLSLKAIAYFRSNGERDLLARALNNYGRALQLSGNWHGSIHDLTTAKEHFIEALSCLEERDKRLRGEILNNMGTTKTRVGMLCKIEEDILSGIGDCLDAARAFDNSGDRTKHALVLMNVGSAFLEMHGYFSKKDYLDKAEGWLFKSVSALENTGATDMAWVARLEFCRTLFAQRKYPECLESVRQALSKLTNIVTKITLGVGAGLQILHRTGPFHTLAAACLAKGNSLEQQRAVVEVEQGKARSTSFYVDLSPDEIEALPDQTKNEYLDLVSKKLFLMEGLFAPREQPSNPEIGEAELRPLRVAQDRIADFTVAHRQALWTNSLSLEDIRSAVPDSGALVFPVLTVSESFVFIVTRDSIRVVQLSESDRMTNFCEASAIESVINSEDSWLRTYHRYLIGQLSIEEWSSYVDLTLESLWRSFLGPTNDCLISLSEVRRMGDIVIIPPGLLGILPLAAARLNRNSPCFGDQWTVSFAPSVRSLIDCRERLSRTKGPDLLAVIDPPHVVNDKGDFAPRLPAAQREGDMLRRLATKLGLADNVLLHAQGRLVRVLKGLPEAYIFHAAAHAEGDVVVPDQTRVLLTGREALFARELRLQPLNRTRLIYLSACESGQTGIFRASDEFIGLPITFIQAGATGVVSTLWVIDDVAACLFAERFYWNLFDEIGDERMSPAAALRKTQQWLRGLTFVEREELLRTSHSVDSHSGPHQYTANSVSPQARPYESPHYWAAFAFTGA